MESTPSELSSLYNINKNAAEETKNNLFIDIFLYSEKHFKQYIEKMNHNLGNYKANQSNKFFLFLFKYFF